MNAIPCYLIPLLVGAICGFLGYLLGKSFARNSDNSKELALQAQLDACLENSKNISQKINTLHSNTTANTNPSTENFTATPPPTTSPKKSETTVQEFDYKAVAAIMGKKIKKDDLKIVEGIGPKIEELFHAAGIKTWLELSELPTSKAQEILTAAGDKFKLHNPASWANQAKMASEGNWNALKKWQDEHKGGKE
jgi:predicted flap endonuclease-1-like 5' DNA nuclease